MNEDIERRGRYSRGYLPHIDTASMTQFLTFRLSDSIPSKVLDEYRREFDMRLITENEYHSILNKYLDKGVGECWLRNPEVADVVEENLLRFAGRRYDLHAWTIMPNHLHTLLTPIPGHSLGSIVHSCKSYTANRANEILGRTGRFWFPEPFDRYIRNRDHFLNVWDYIDNNPVKARLCEYPEQWRYSSAWHNYRSAVRVDELDDLEEL